MLKFTPLLLMLAYGAVSFALSTWRTKRTLDQNSEPLDEPGLEAVVRRLGRAVDIPHLQAHVWRMEMFNGLAAPDGRIFITTNVVERYKRGEITAEEVGSIIAHELGHVALGHSRRRMIDGAGLYAVQVVLSRFVPLVGVYLAQFLAGLVSARLSRKDEYDADAYAAALMKRAGLDPRAQQTMFEKLARISPRSGEMAWMQSHPPVESRIARIRDLSQGWNENA